MVEVTADHPDLPSTPITIPISDYVSHVEMTPARLLFPALRWQDGGFVPDEDKALEMARRGVGGFILFGGPAGEVEGLTRRLQEAAPHRLLFGADLERGAGQQFQGATPLPPLAALASLRDPVVLWQAGHLTAREAGALGVKWIYAPVADLANEPDNPIVGTRSPGSDPEVVARAVTAWILGCQAAGGLACAKHFPGHGRTRSDSHLELPVVTAGAEELARDLIPFAAAVEAGVSTVMTAHVAYPALDPSGVPATRSHPIVEGVLRERLGFGGVAVTDAIIMGGFGGTAAEEGRAEEGAGEAQGGAAAEGDAAVQALVAGVDALLYPDDALALEATLRSAMEEDRLPERRVREALARIEALAGRSDSSPSGPTGGRWGREEDRTWVRSVAERTIRWMVQPPEQRAGRRIVLHTVDDDLGGPYPAPDRSILPAVLKERGVEVVDAAEIREAGESVRGESTPPTVVAVYADIRGWKGRAGLSEEARQKVRDLTRSSDVIVVLFGHPRLAAALPQDRPVLSAWGGEPVMQEAAAAILARRLVGEEVPARDASPGSS